MEERDEVIERMTAQLRVLPEVDESAKARLLIAVAAERQRDRDAVVQRGSRVRWLRWTGSGALAAAAMIAAVFLGMRPARNGSSNQTAVAAAPPAVAPSAQLAGNDPAAVEMAPQAVQFVFRAPSASSVTVVGDFNTWEKAPMARDAASGLWSITVMIRPGRHVYAFVVDDSIWTRDPRAVAAPDADFGRPGSVLLVGRRPVAATP